MHTILEKRKKYKKNSVKTKNNKLVCDNISMNTEAMQYLK